jgi:hypothetical protein
MAAFGATLLRTSISAVTSHSKWCREISVAWRLEIAPCDLGNLIRDVTVAEILVFDVK